VLGVLDVAASLNGITDSTGTAQGTKPGSASRPGYYAQRPVPVFKPQAIAFKGEVFAYSFSRGTARGAQGFAGRAISAPLTTEGRATRSAWGYAGRIKAASHTKELRVRGWGRTHEERQRETTTGFEISKGAITTLKIGNGDVLYAISDAADTVLDVYDFQVDP